MKLMTLAFTAMLLASPAAIHAAGVAPSLGARADNIGSFASANGIGESNVVPVGSANSAMRRLASPSGPNHTVALEKERFPSYFPPFSWDRVPVYQQFGEPDRLLTDEEIAQIASTTDFITIEKSQGYKIFGASDLGAKHVIARFKALKPGMKCLFYFNSAYAYPYATDSKMFTPQNIFEEKYKIFRSFLLTYPKTDEPRVRVRDGVYEFDVLNPQFRTWWAETVGKYVRETGADGLFVDQMHGFAFLRPKKKSEVEKAQAEMMRMAKKAIGPNKILLLNNAAQIPELFEIGDAFMFEHYNASLLTKENILQDWMLMKKISRARKIAVWRIGVNLENRHPDQLSKRDGATDGEYASLAKKRLPFYLAAFLIGAQPYSYFQYGWGWGLQTGLLAEYSEFNKPLGKPLGEYTRPDPNGWVFRREFEHASVWVDLDTRKGKIQWK